MIRELTTYLLALIFPGLGHWRLGLRLNAALFAAAIVPLFWAGVLMGGDLTFVTTDMNMMGIFGSQFLFTRALPTAVSVIKVCAGAVFYLPGLWLQHALAPWHETTRSIWLEIATNYCLVAGLLNVLAVMNLFYRLHHNLFVHVRRDDSVL